MERLTHDRAELRGQRPPAGAQARRRDERDALSELLAPPADELMEMGEESVFARPGVQRALVRRLRRGDFAVERELDLHGHTAGEAHGRLVEFLREARAAGRRCVRIVHGKGLRSPNRRPVLKGKIDAWLRRRDEVLAFCSAPARDGGTGALYVLLKK